MVTAINPFAKKKVLVVHHWPHESQRTPLFSEDMLYFSVHGAKAENVITFPLGTMVDMEQVLGELKKQHWLPDLFIAKVDAFQNIVPVNVKALNCPKVLVLGDTQHGENPLLTMLNYATSEKYDYYISDHKRHHLWLYYLAGIKQSYWLPGLFLKPPPDNLDSMALTGIDDKLFKGQPVFIGQFGHHHPRRKRLIESLKRELPYLYTGAVDQQVSLKIYNQASVSLNISLNADLNLRFLEIPSARGLQVADRLSVESGADLLFQEDKEIVYFDDHQQLIEKVRFYHENKKENDRIRNSGFRRYYNEYRPELMVQNLADILAGRRVDSRFSSSSVARIRDIERQRVTVEQIVIYQIIQDLHRQRERVVILMDGDIVFAMAEDFLDLPRVEVTVYDPAMNNERRLKRYREKSADTSRLKFLRELKHIEKADIILSRGPTFFPAVLLKSDEDLVIYGKKEVNSNELEIGFCKKRDLM